MAPQRPRQHEIDTQAQAILAELTARSLILNRHDNDYGIDYTAELVSKDVHSGKKQASGCDFQIQLKGADCLYYSKKRDFITFAMETRILKYYEEAKRLPVFLMLVDVNTRRAFWLFLQEHIALRLRDPKWHRQQRVQIQIPITQRLDDEEAFATAVRAAGERMLALRPSATQRALAAETSLLEAINPNFRIEATATEAGTQYVLHPKVPVSGKITISGLGANVKRCATDLVEKGLPIDATAYGVQVSVSHLLAHMGDTGSIIKLAITHEAPGSLRLVRLRNGVVGESLELDGRWAGGTKEARLNVELSPGILRFVATIRPPSDGTLPLSMEFRYDLQTWLGRNIVTDLAQFDRLRRIFGDLREGDLMRIELYRDGNWIGTADQPTTSLAALIQLGSVVAAIDKARFVSRRTGISITMTEPPTLQDLQDIEVAHAFLSGQPIAQKDAHVTFVTSTPRTRAGHLKVGDVVKGGIQCEHGRFECTMFGHTIPCGRALLRSDSATLTVTDIADSDDRDSNDVSWSAELAESRVEPVIANGVGDGPPLPAS